MKATTVGQHAGDRQFHEIVSEQVCDIRRGKPDEQHGTDELVPLGHGRTDQANRPAIDLIDAAVFERPDLD